MTVGSGETLIKQAREELVNLLIHINYERRTFDKLGNSDTANALAWCSNTIKSRLGFLLDCEVLDAKKYGSCL